MKDGFIKLHRQITDHWLWNNGEPFDKRSAWIDLILMANWKTATRSFGGQIVQQKRGEVLISIGKLAKRWMWSENKVRRFLDDLVAEGMVRTDGRARGTSITIENYALFQDARRADGRADERADGRAHGRLQKKNKEEQKETRARGGDTPVVAPPTPEEKEEIERLLGMVVN